MRRSRASRIFAALFAPWFAIVVAEPVPMHDCPVHSVHAAAAHAMAPAHSMAGQAATTGHAGMEHSDVQLPPSHQAPGHQGHKQCCCLDSSCASAIASLTRAPQLAWVPAEIQSESPRSAAPFVTSLAAEHVLPFANGPPPVFA